ncbi:MAG TPA: hypothetical protein VN366_10965 [Feifaniaceae bacterium]|nr:hypothetical protein [Feifaniaceae bacterium]
MNEIRAAVIDIGSNSIRYFCASVTPQGVAAFAPKRLVTTRLAEGILNTGCLQEAATARSLAAVSDFCALAAEQGAKEIYAYATSAVRDAKNRKVFLSRVRENCNIDVDVLTGVEEARLAYLGAAGQFGGGLIDVGGGSAQVITPKLAHSFPVGCVRAKELCEGLAQKELPRAVEAWLDRTIADRLSGIGEQRWTGVGGTVTTLGALQAGLAEYDSFRVNRETLAQDGVLSLYEDLLAMGDARRKHPLLTDRHDIIPFGALIVWGLMKRLDIGALRVSDADGMEGYLMDRAAR